MRLLAQVKGQDHPRDADFLVALAEETPLEDLPRLIAGLETLTWSSCPKMLFGYDPPKQTSRAHLLFDGLCRALARCIELAPDSVSVANIDRCFTVGWYSRLDRDHEERDLLSAALLTAPSMRHRLLHAAVAETRLKLALLVHDAVPFADDEPSRDGMQSISPRREREDVRRTVENQLGDDFSQAGREALLTFIEAKIKPVYPEWGRRWEASHARAAAVSKPWSVDQVRSFVRRGTIAPQNGDALLAGVIEEIADIELMLDASEFDRRALFNVATSENDFRAWLGHELDRRIQGWAAITQETVTRGEKRTDLRVELRGGDRAVLIIEIKLSHRWQRNVLIDKMKSQLVDQYLIGDPRIQHGLYLLVDFSLPLKGALPDGSSPDCRKFIPYLVDRAAALTIPGQVTVRTALFAVDHD